LNGIRAVTSSKVKHKSGTQSEVLVYIWFANDLVL